MNKCPKCRSTKDLDFEPGIVFCVSCKFRVTPRRMGEIINNINEQEYSHKDMESNLESLNNL